ncbi:RHS repeat domain-containing protein [Marinoscillum sp.]|uniref:RHS repeat domain-containing protein n=1 Tax=Marinoscillum sp. TaxID=2024838 RepID=UPI003BA9EDE9
MKKILTLTLTLLLIWLTAFAQDKSGKIVDSNNISIEGVDLGALKNSVNLYTGEVKLPIKLISAPAKNSLGIDVNISYNSAVQVDASTINEESPTGTLGLGWMMKFPEIVIDHKNTGNQHDDQYYLLDGSKTELIYTGTESYYSKDLNTTYTAEIFESKNYTNWKIRRVSSRERWEITKEDGKVYIYGDRYTFPSSIQWSVRWGNWVGNSSISTGQKQMPRALSISKVIDRNETDYLLYNYDKVENKLGSSSGLNHTEASYIESIENALGYRVEFSFTGKQSYEYYEPHKEQAEPDAYQEIYEKEYLSSVRLYNGNVLVKSVNLNYHPLTYLSTDNDLKKRLLSNIKFSDRYSGSTTEASFEYYTDNTYKGALKSVTSKSGAKVNYVYTSTTIGDLDDIIYAPNGYSEPQIWQGPGYVVVCWRQLSGGSHDDTDRPVKVYAYTWNGKWQEQYITQINHVDKDDLNDRYKEFFVETQKDFFAIATPAENNNCELWLVSKNDNSGQWSYSKKTVNIGSHKPSLVSGESFIGLGRRREGSSTSPKLTVFIKNNNYNSWRSEVINDISNTRDPFHLGKLNYIFTAYEIGDNNYRRINYLTRDKTFSSKSTYDGNDGYDGDVGVSSNSFVALKYSNGRVMSYRWDEYYNQTSTLIGTNFSNLMRLQTVNNSMLQASDYYQNIVNVSRYTGNSWNTYVEGTENHIWRNSLNDDFFVWSESNGGWDGYRIEFNPNSTSWKTRAKLPEHPDHINGGQTIGSFWGNYSYYWPYIHKRSNTGSWSTFYTTELTNTNGESSYVYGSPNFFFHEQSNGTGAYKYTIYNGEVNKQSIDAGRTTGFFANEAGGLGVFITYNSSDEWSATNLKLHKVIRHSVGGGLSVKPIRYIYTQNGFHTTYTAYDFNTSTATLSDDGKHAYFNEATEVKGSSTTSSTPYGKTVSYFFNGGVIDNGYLTSVQSMSPLVMGLNYKQLIYDNNGIEVANQETYYVRKYSSIENSANQIIGTSDVILPRELRSTVDGVETVTQNTYNTYNQVSEQVSYNYGSDGTSDIHKESRKYYWEEYDPDRSENLYSPVIQTTNYVDNINKASTVITWKNGMPYRKYSKVSSGSDFNDWSNTGSVNSNWKKNSEMIYDSESRPVEITDLTGIKSSTLYREDRAVLKVYNAELNEIWSEDFDHQSYNGTTTWSVPLSSSDWSVSSGTAVFNHSGNTGMMYTTIGSIPFGSNYILEFDFYLESNATNGYIALHFDKPSSGNGYQLNIEPDGTVKLYESGSLIKTASTDMNLFKWQPCRLVKDGTNLYVYIGNEKVLRSDVSDINGTRLELWSSSIKSAFDNLRLYPEDAYAVSSSYNLLTNEVTQIKKETGSTNYLVNDQYYHSYAKVDHNLITQGSSSTYLPAKYSLSTNSTNPVIGLQTQPMGTSGYHHSMDYNIGEWTASGGTWDFQNGYLWHENNAGANSSISLDLPETLSGRVGVEFTVKMPAYLSGSSNTFNLGYGLGTDTWNGSEGSSGNIIYNKFMYDGSTFDCSLPTVRQVNMRMGQSYKILSLLDFENQQIDLYVDGKFISSESFQTTAASLGKVTFFNKGGYAYSTNWVIDNLLIHTDPVLTAHIADGSGNIRQNQTSLPANKLMVNELFYDGLNRAYVKTRDYQVSGPFGFKGSFAGFDSSTKLLSGSVSTAFGAQSYSGTIYEKSPLGRVIESKIPGNSFVLGGSRTTTTSFGNNGQTGLNIEDEVDLGVSLPSNKYNVRKTTNADGLETYELNNMMGNAVLSKTGTVKGTSYNRESYLFDSNGIEVAINSPIAQTINYYILSKIIQPLNQSSSYPAFIISSSPGGSGDILVDTDLGNGTFTVPAGTFYLKFEYSSTNYRGSLDMVTSINQNDDIFLYSYRDYDHTTSTLYQYPPNYFDVGLSQEDRNSFITETKYDYLGQVIESKTPESGITKYKYDQFGRIRFIENAEGREYGYFTYRKYNSLGKVIEEGYVYSNFSTANPNNQSWPTSPATWRKKFYYGDHEKTTYDRGEIVQIKVNNDSDNAVEVTESIESNDGEGFENTVYTRLHGEAVHMPAMTYSRNNIGQVSVLSYTRPDQESIDEVITGEVDFQAVNVVFDGTQIEATADVIVLAKASIVLKPGFTAKSGSSFLASTGSSLVEDDKILYTYDISGRLVTIGTESNPDFYAQYTYGANGAITQERLNNQTLNTSYSYYDDNGWLQEIEVPSKFKESIEYTTNAYGTTSGYFTGLISKVSYDYPDALSVDDYNVRYKYDKLGRLLVADNSRYHAQDIGVGGIMQYDRNGNILRKRVQSSNWNYTYEAGTNKVISLNSSSALGTYSYDKKGNIVSNSTDGLSSITYDKGIGLTSSIDLTGEMTTFQYGAKNQRLIKADEEGSNTYKTYYAHGQSEFPVLEIHDDGSSQTRIKYIHGLNGLIAYHDGSWNFVARDHLGSTRAVFNASNSQVAGYSYRPFGMKFKKVGSEDISPQFAGQEYDSETGLHNFRSRLYDEELGRFLSMDPQGQFASPYVAMNNNPVMYVDPNGELVFVPILVAAATGAFKGAMIGGSFATLFNVTYLLAGGDPANTIDTGEAMKKGAIKGAITGGLGEAFSQTGVEHLGKLDGVGGGLAKLGYEAATTTATSVVSNVVVGDEPFSQLNVGVGPLTVPFRDGKLSANPVDYLNNLPTLVTFSKGLYWTAKGEFNLKWDWDNFTPYFVQNSDYSYYLHYLGKSDLHEPLGPGAALGYTKNGVPFLRARLDTELTTGDLFGGDSYYAVLFHEGVHVQQFRFGGDGYANYTTNALERIYGADYNKYPWEYGSYGAHTITDLWKKSILNGN